MKRSAVASDILSKIEACFGVARCQDYIFSRTRGIPPADCNSITAAWVDRSTKAVDGDSTCDQLEPCGNFDADHTLRITLTRICMGPDQKPGFDWRMEDAAAACFDDDLDQLEECIECGDWSIFRTDHSVYRVKYLNTTYDVQSQGGGFSAYIDVQITAAECCP